MPRKTKDALTNTRIRKAKIKDKQYKLFDGQGLIVLIHPNGSKYFRWRYYIAVSYTHLTLPTILLV